MDEVSAVDYLEGPSTQSSRTLVPNSIQARVLGERNLMSWVGGPPGWSGFRSLVWGFRIPKAA